ncbi:MAG: Panacea domain-containing protein [Candidatus Sulfotelmatobacter sp.]
MKKRAKTRRQAKRLQSRITPNENKFRELLLFIARRSEGDPRFGAIKLNKLLFYSDFLAYLELGHPITGQPYFALENGPAPRYLVRVREQMVKSKEIAIARKTTFSGVQERVLALREPDPNKFTPAEIDLVTKVLDVCRSQSGTDLSELSHRFAGWRLAGDKEDIPYEVALVGNRPPTPAEKSYGIKLEALAASCLTENAAGLG